MGDLVLVLLLDGLEGMEAELRRALGAQLAAGEDGVLLAEDVPDFYRQFTRNSVSYAVMHASQVARFDPVKAPFTRISFVDANDALDRSSLPAHASVVRTVKELRNRSSLPPPPSVRSVPPRALQDAQRKLFRVLQLASADTDLEAGWLARRAVLAHTDLSESALPNHVSRLKQAGVYIETRDEKMCLKSTLRVVDHFLCEEALRWSAENFGFDEPPLIVHKKDADNREHWGPDWDFSIALTQGLITLTPERSEGRSYSVSINVKGELGIYRNRAKRFLREHFLDARNRATLAQKSRVLHDATLRAVRGQLEDAVSCNPEGIHEFPFRWASGGSLLLVNWRGRRWALVFFRDIRPVGWNLANGASESTEEQDALVQLIERETMEEVVFLATEPRRGEAAEALTLELEWDPKVQRARWALAERLLRAHHGLRREEDGFSLSVSPRAAKVDLVKGPGTIELNDGKASAPAGKYLYVTIDPLDFGLEAIQIGKVDLPANGYVLDGEVIEGSQNRQERVRLARRPVGLLALEYLERCWKKSDQPSLGVVVDAETDEHRMGGKELPSMSISEDVAETDLYVFDHDYRWRQTNVASGGADDDRWLESFGEDFDAFFTRKHASARLRTLCPVTWKVIEQALARGDLQDS